MLGDKLCKGKNIFKTLRGFGGYKKKWILQNLSTQNQMQQY